MDVFKKILMLNTIYSFFFFAAGLGLGSKPLASIFIGLLFSFLLLPATLLGLRLKLKVWGVSALGSLWVILIFGALMFASGISYKARGQIIAIDGYLNFWFTMKLTILIFIIMLVSNITFERIAPKLK